jgi:hypothetical protein
MPNRPPPFLIALTAVCTAVALAGCAAGSLGAQGAAEGGKSGALAGAVAGAVGSIFWGGNVVENMATSAVVGAATGAVVGGVAGNSQDKAIEAKRNMSEADAAILKRIGPDNFAAAKELAYCRHKTAVGKARTAYGLAPTDDWKHYALLIESIADEEMGDTAAAQKVYPLMVTLNPQTMTVDSARNEALSGILKVQKARADRGLPATCR